MKISAHLLCNEYVGIRRRRTPYTSLVNAKDTQLQACDGELKLAGQDLESPPTFYLLEFQAQGLAYLVAHGLSFL